MPDDEKTLHDVISDAIDAQGVTDEEESGRPEPEVSEVAVGATEAEPESTARERDENGRFKAAADAVEAASEAAGAVEGGEGEPTPAVTPPVDASEAQPVEGAPAEPVIEVRAPQSWKPGAREHWAKLPPEVQTEVARREIETARVLSETAEARKQATAFREVYAPYEAMIRAEGGTPEKAAADLFQTAAALRTAPPHHKANLVAHIVKQYGVDVSMLDAALSGIIAGNPQQQQQPMQQQPMQDPRLDQMLSVMQQNQQQAQQSQQQAATQEVESFSVNHEFYSDVREDMADLIEMADRRQVTLSLEDAYTRAVRVHPEISAIIAQREQAQNAQAATTQRVKNKAAASSVSGSPAGAPPSSGPLTRRQAIEDAFDAVD